MDCLAAYLRYGYLRFCIGGRTMNSDSFPTIQAILPGRIRGEKIICDCPFCDDTHKHFAYSKKGWYKCVRCNTHGGNLRKLAEMLRLEIGEYVPPRSVERKEPEIARWRLNPWELLRRYKAHPRRITAWQSYKPLTAETIERHRLGYGSLPFQRDDDSWYMSRSQWLIVPLYEDGALVALRGRNTGTRGPKWISATGSNYALWNVENVTPDSICWLTENYVDAAWLMQEHPDWSAVATGGVTNWRTAWAKQMADRRPALVVVALDNDLVGNGGRAHRKQLIRAWKTAHPGIAVPNANGPIIANDLIHNGLKTRLFRWPDNAPEKAGLDWILQGNP